MGPKAGRPRRDAAHARDVRGRLLSAASQLLTEVDDPIEITVADLVDRAGCTPPSLYHHFSNRESLLRAAAEEELGVLAADINRVASGHTGVDGLVKRALAYFDFASSNPAIYRTLFMGRGDGPTSADSDQPGSGLVDLIEAVDACLPPTRSDEAFAVAFGLWGIMHGLAAIHVSNPIIPSEFVRSALESTLRANAVGHGLIGRRSVSQGEGAD